MHAQNIGSGNHRLLQPRKIVRNGPHKREKNACATYGVHGEAGAVPVDRCTQAAELLVDAVAVPSRECGQDGDEGFSNGASINPKHLLLWKNRTLDLAGNPKTSNGI